MTAVYFTTIPCELNTTKETNHIYFYEIRPGSNNIVYVSFDFYDFFVRFYGRV